MRAGGGRVRCIAYRERSEGLKDCVTTWLGLLGLRHVHLDFNGHGSRKRFDKILPTAVNIIFLVNKCHLVTIITSEII